MHFSHLSCEQLYRITYFLLRRNLFHEASHLKRCYEMISSCSATQEEKQQAFDDMAKNVFHAKGLRDSNFCRGRTGRSWGLKNQVRLINMLLYKMAEAYALKSPYSIEVQT